LRGACASPRGGHLEVHGGLAGTDQAGSAVGHTLQVGAVARHARGLEELLAGAQQAELRLVGDGNLRLRRQDGNEATGECESDQQQHCCREASA
jgi:hypothetical protein